MTRTGPARRPFYADTDEYLLRMALDGVILKNIAFIHGLELKELNRRLARAPGESEKNWLARKCTGIWDNVWEKPFISRPRRRKNTKKPTKKRTLQKPQTGGTHG